jgi:hypothetical protein
LVETVTLRTSVDIAHTGFAVQQQTGGLSSLHWIVELHDVALFGDSLRSHAHNPWIGVKPFRAMDQLRFE